MAKPPAEDNHPRPAVASAGDFRVFDRLAHRRNRDRAMAGFGDHDFLVREAAANIVARIGDIRRTFSRVLDLGGQCEGPKGARFVVRADMSMPTSMPSLQSGPEHRVITDDEFLPFAPESFDLVVSALSLHWVNDLPGTLWQIRRSLRPDGLFLAAMPGGETLTELRQALLEAETVIEGGVSPRVSPFTDIRLAGGLLQRAGFALPVVDVDTLTVTYPDAFALMRDLKGMGEANAHMERRRGFTRRRTLMTAVEAYHARHALPDGRVPATFQILYLTGWAPHESQQQPLRPGSARARLADALGVPEHPAGDKAGRG